MRPLRRLVLVLAALLGVGCSRSFNDSNLLDAYHFDGSTLIVYVHRESGVHEERGSAFNPNGPQTHTTVATSDLHRLTFTVAGTIATFTGTEQVLHQEGRSIRENLTMAPGFLDRQAPPVKDDAEIHLLAPLGNAYLVKRDKRYTVYADRMRQAILDQGEHKTYDALHFTWSGERLYYVTTAPDGRQHIHTTAVGSGVWSEVIYDARTQPLDKLPGNIYVEGYDRIDNDDVLLLRKSYTYTDPRLGDGRTSYSLLRGTRLLATWTGNEPGFIRPDLRALVGWQDRAYRKLTATLSLRSLDDGTERRVAVDAGAGVK